MRKRIAKEIQHGRFLAAHGAGEIWNWESPAGKLRWIAAGENAQQSFRARNESA